MKLQRAKPALLWLWRLAVVGKNVKLLWKKASDSAFRFLLVTVENHRCQQD